MTAPDPTKDRVTDPVCGLKVTAGKGIPVEFDGRTYHFCADGCRRSFEADPAKYLLDKAPKPKGFWGRYLHRLNRATGGKPPSCCR